MREHSTACLCSPQTAGPLTLASVPQSPLHSFPVQSSTSVLCRSVHARTDRRLANIAHFWIFCLSGRVRRTEGRSRTRQETLRIDAQDITAAIFVATRPVLAALPFADGSTRNLLAQITQLQRSPQYRPSFPSSAIVESGVGQRSRARRYSLHLYKRGDFLLRAGECFEHQPLPTSRTTPLLSTAVSNQLPVECRLALLYTRDPAP